jgi:hypothetical protein
LAADGTFLNGTPRRRSFSGVGVSADLFTWRLSGERPWVTSPHRGGSVRYLDALVVGGRWWLYYEMTRADGAHELRVITR